MALPALDEAYNARIKALRDRLTQFVEDRFKAGEYRDADLERFLNQVVPVMLAARRQVSAMTDAYLSRKLGLPATGPVDTDVLRGVEATEVYTRPYVTVRTKLSEGLTYDAAVSAGLARAVDIVLTDLQLAKTTTTQNVYRSAGVTRYIRVLTGSSSCALCYLASTQTYSTDQLLPIHPGCDCSTAPAPSNFDGTEQLGATHEAIEDRLGVSDSGGRAPDYRKQLIVQEHGELGPVLTVKGQTFTGPSAIN